MLLIMNLLLLLQIHTIAIIAEGIPEAQTRKLIKRADENGITIIGPATVSTSLITCNIETEYGCILLFEH